MTAPRQILQGATYLVTRRCAQRQFLLKPSKTTNTTFLYLVALAARRFGIQVHAFCVLSNHFHLVLTDPCAQLPAFHQLLDALVARALNSHLGRWESFWAPNSYSAVRLIGPGDILDKTAYVLANPVAAGLVTSGRGWQGLWSAPERMGGEPIEAPRPVGFFDPRGHLPDRCLLQLTVPPGFASAAEFRASLQAALAVREQDAARAARGRSLDAQRTRRAVDRPNRPEPRRGLNPRVAARDGQVRRQALAGMVAFLQAYREAWTAWRAGKRSAVFPLGTYLMRVLHGAPCASAG